MTENELVANLFGVLKAGFATREISVGMQQNYQPRTEGAPSGPCIFFHKITDNEYGFPGRSNAYSVETQTMVHTETQIIETTFQVNAQSPVDPYNTTQLLPGDYVKIAARIFGSDAARVALLAFGIGIYRIRKITNTFFRDERAENEASPSFDFTVTYPSTETTVVGSTNVLTGNIYKIA